MKNPMFVDAEEHRTTIQGWTKHCCYWWMVLLLEFVRFLVIAGMAAVGQILIVVGY